MSSKLPIRVDPAARVPLATQLSQQLSWLIIGGVLEEDDSLPPAHDLADDLNINFHTVRAAYQQLESDGLVSVSRGRRARVLAYDTTRIAVTMANVPSYSIGVIIPDFVPFYGPLLSSIEESAADLPALVFIANAREDPTTAVAYLDRLVSRGVDGIIVAAPLLEPGVRLPPPGRPPIVFVDAPGAPGPTIEFDLKGSQLMSTGHLIEHGHDRIGYITPPTELPNVAPKLSGHLDALDAAGIDSDPDLIAIASDFEINSGYEAAERLLDLASPPTAIAAAVDNLALGAHHAINARGLDIPRDIALTGNDGTELGAIIRPSLTTVSIPVAEAGRLAVGMLKEMSEERQPKPLHRILDVELIVRDSCGCKPLIS